MKKLLFSLAAIFALASCKKETNVNTPPPPPPVAEKKLKNYISIFNNGAPSIYDYSYDAQGRLITVVGNYDFDEFDFSQSNTIVVTARKKIDNSIKYTLECKLDADGRIIKMTDKNPGNAITGIYELVYNADGYLSKYKSVSFSNNAYVGEWEYIYENGNPVIEKYYINGSLFSTIERKFDVNKPNRDPWKLASWWPSEKWFGKGFKNLATEWIAKNANGNITSEGKFSYELDATGYLLKRIETNTLTGNQTVKTYIYE